MVSCWMGVLVVSFPLQAQSVKIGYVNTAEILQAMPEAAKAQEELQKYAQQLEEQLQQMMDEYQQKLAEYEENKELWPQTVREIKEKEILTLQLNIQEYRLKAQQDLQIKQQELMQPIVEKIQRAVEEVARERGYDYVIDASTGVLLVSPPGDDLTLYVKRKLGLQ